MKTIEANIRFTSNNTVGSISLTDNKNIIETYLQEYNLLLLLTLESKLTKKLLNFNCVFDLEQEYIYIKSKNNKTISIKGLNALKIIIDDSIIKFVL